MKLAVQVRPELFIEYKTKYKPVMFQKFIAGFLAYLANQMVLRIKEVVDKQQYKWRPLSPRWLDFKKEMGLSPKTWIASGELENSIKAWHSDLMDSYLVGVNSRKLHHKYKKGGIFTTIRTKTLLITIIRRLEYGNKKMPPRPLFGPVIQEFQRDLNKHYKNYLKIVVGG